MVEDEEKEEPLDDDEEDEGGGVVVCEVEESNEELLELSEDEVDVSVEREEVDKEVVIGVVDDGIEEDAIGGEHHQGSRLNISSPSQIGGRKCTYRLIRRC